MFLMCDLLRPLQLFIREHFRFTPKPLCVGYGASQVRSSENPRGTSIVACVCYEYISRLLQRGWAQWGIPLAFRPFRGASVGRTRQRQALPRVPTCGKRNTNALAIRPQPMLSTQTLFCFVFVHLFGPNGKAGQRAEKGAPKVKEVYPRELTRKYQYLLCTHKIDHDTPPPDHKHTLLCLLLAASKATTRTYALKTPLNSPNRTRAERPEVESNRDLQSPNKSRQSQVSNTYTRNHYIVAS